MEAKFLVEVDACDCFHVTYFIKMKLIWTILLIRVTDSLRIVRLYVVEESIAWAYPGFQTFSTTFFNMSPLAIISIEQKDLLTFSIKTSTMLSRRLGAMPPILVMSTRWHIEIWEPCLPYWNFMREKASSNEDGIRDERTLVLKGNQMLTRRAKENIDTKARNWVSENILALRREIIVRSKTI